MTPLNRRQATAVFAVVFLLFAMCSTWATGSPETEAAENGSTSPLVVRYPQSASSVPFLAVMDTFPEEYDGAFFSDHAQALAQLLTGEIDLLATGFSVGYARAMREGDLVHVATPVWGASAVMVREGIDDYADMRGGTVYAPFEGSPIDIFLRVLFERLGLSDEITIAYAPFPQSAAIVAQGDAVAAVLVEPIASRLELSGAAVRLENVHDRWAEIAGGDPRSPQVSLFATASVAESKRPQISLFLSRLSEEVTQVGRSPDGYAPRYAETLGFPAPVVEGALRNTLFDLPDAAESRRLIEDYSQVMGSAVPPDRFYASVE